MSAYRVEELLAIRDSVSESAVSLDKFADEDVIKEHVLRPSASANLIGLGAAPSAAPGVAAVTAGKKPSPSPSVKRGKAERLLKEHGSPPGLRVTAGGRIVPSDLPPLGSARFTSNGLKAQPPSTVTLNNSLPGQAQLDLSSLPQNIQFIGGQPVLCLGDHVFQIPTLPQTQNTFGTFVPTITPSVQPATGVTMSTLAITYPGVGAASQSPNSWEGLDLPGLKQRHQFKKAELRSLEQQEVIEGPKNDDVWRQRIVAVKKALVTEIDAMRKTIKVKEGNPTTSSDSASSQPSFFQPPSAVVPTMGNPSFAPTPMGGQVVGPMYPTIPPTGQPIHQYGYAQANAVQLPSGSYPPSGHQPSPNAVRRSHAVAIKPPQGDPKKPSTLNPKSPTYEPTAKFVQPTPFSAKGPTPRSSGEEKSLKQKPSMSSIDTTDFFPTNTHEHSTTRTAPGEQSSRENVMPSTPRVPSTPQKLWGPDPWNPPSRGRYQQLPSRGSNQQLPSGGSMTNLSGATFGASPAPTKNFGTLATGSRRGVPPGSAMESSGGGLWPLTDNPTNHTFSTYQEGFQAGLNHLGLPDNIDVLCGYLEGLGLFLKGGNSRSPSFVSFPASGTLPRQSSKRGQTELDSGISLAFRLQPSPFGAKENLQSAQLPAKEYGTQLEASVRAFARTPGNNDFLKGPNWVPNLDGAMDDLADQPAKEALDESVETEASCFGKSKAKEASSPAKTSSPGKKAESPAKSPAKASLENVSRTGREKWHRRFAIIKRVEDQQVQETMERQSGHRRRSTKPNKTGVDPSAFGG
ncbi:hypothetical protein BCR34DRAFT_666554 [Clohesyomyces aquaticus]|uniref:Uncharacterized protein n=1 Tax=Clohesyomyces aquaticus TaxID=1231657 RepID=A0A1Y1Z8Q0_9PLEO|nr:hypothetical protein BCR34DRAFT_666554 [Clohesyomyces aquaticus]